MSTYVCVFRSQAGTGREGAVEARAMLKDIESRLAVLVKEEDDVDFEMIREVCSASELQKVWQKYSGLRASNRKMQEKFDQLVQEEGMEGKRRALSEWLGQKVMKRRKVVSRTQEQENSQEWVPWAVVVSHYGKAEAEARVKAGSITARKDPRNQAFFQFSMVRTISSQKDKVEVSMEEREDSA